MRDDTILPPTLSSDRTADTSLISLLPKPSLFAEVQQYLLGQAFFSREAIKTVANARSIRTVALCTRDDLFMRSLAEHQGIEVVVIDRDTKQVMLAT